MPDPRRNAAPSRTTRADLYRVLDTYLAALKAMGNVQKRQQQMYDSLAALLRKADHHLASLKDDTTSAGKDEKIRLLAEGSDILKQQLAGCMGAKSNPLPPVIRPKEDSAKIKAGLLRERALNERIDSLSAIIADKNILISKKDAIIDAKPKTNKLAWWLAGAGILASVVLGFIGSKGGWIVALIKMVPKIIQLFKKHK